MTDIRELIDMVTRPYKSKWDEIVPLLPSVKDINEKGVDGRTLLTQACYSTSYENEPAIEVVKAILAIPGIDINLANGAGITPLGFANHNASLECCDEIVGMLENFQAHEEILEIKWDGSNTEVITEESKVTSAWTPDTPKEGIFDNGFKL